MKPTDTRISPRPALLATLLVATLAVVSNAQAPKTIRLAGHTSKAVLDGTAKLAGHHDPNQMLRLAVALRPPHADEEQQFIEELHTKGSPQFHHFLTAAEWNARFAPSADDEQAVVNWAESQHLKVTNRYPNRLVVDVEATMGDVERALDVTMNRYQIGSLSYFSNDRDPSIPVNLASAIHSVLGLNNIDRMHANLESPGTGPGPIYVSGPVAGKGDSARSAGDGTRLQRAKAQGPNGGLAPEITGGNLDPTDIFGSNGYDYKALNNQGHCCNPLGNPNQSPKESSIAIATAYGLNFNDLSGFQSQYPYLAYNVQAYNIDGTAVGVPNCPTGVPNCNIETTLDVEWTTSTANSLGSAANTAMVYVYQGVNSLPGTFTDVYEQILTDGNAHVLSVSWGCAEGTSCAPTGSSKGDMTADDNIFRSMIGQGWTLVAASGDQGASAFNGSTQACSTVNAVNFPASDPNFVAVGGTNLALNGSGTFSSEVAWTGGNAPPNPLAIPPFPGSCGVNNGGSGGGCSVVFGAPSYQKNVPCGTGSRAVPDVALNAVGQNIYFNGSLQGVGGTSLAAPEMAGFFAQENAYLLYLGNLCNGSACAPIGNPNYLLYETGLHPNSVPYYPFYDITSGCNSNDVTATFGLTVYCASPGYDLVTGWGSPNMLHLAWAINSWLTADEGPVSVKFQGPSINHWYNKDQPVTWIAWDQYGSKNMTPAGTNQGWDSAPGNIAIFSEPTPGQGNFFWDGPQSPNNTGGSFSLASAGSQGCHTAEVVAWNNAGYSSLIQSYGPLCYDTVAPKTTASLACPKCATPLASGSTYGNAVQVTLTATDQGFKQGSSSNTGSGVANTFYQIDNGKQQTYSGPFTVTAAGSHTVTFHSVDVAGNVESSESANFSIVLPAELTSSQITTKVSSFTYNSSTQTFTGTVAITNNTRSAINSPIQIVFTGLPSGVTLKFPTGTYQGSPYLTCGVTSIPAGLTATIGVAFTGPKSATISFTPVIYTGNLN